jgi:Mrp family chromosome partitioning ATPase
MSRHFDLFEQIDRERAGQKPVATWGLRSGGHPNLQLDDFSRTEVEKLVNRLYLLPGVAAPRMVVFTSFEPGGDCSWVCAHASDLLASRLSASVCLVDANLRAPSLHRRFGVPNNSGLTGLVENTGLNLNSVITQVPGGDLWLLTCGMPNGDCESLVHSENMQQRMNELRSRFDLILVDASAISTSRDALMLGRMADGVVLVLRAHSTRRESARHLKQEFDDANVRILGAILNNRKFPIPETIYKRL